MAPAVKKNLLVWRNSCVRQSDFPTFFMTGMPVIPALWLLKLCQVGMQATWDPLPWTLLRRQWSRCLLTMA